MNALSPAWSCPSLMLTFQFHPWVPTPPGDLSLNPELKLPVRFLMAETLTPSINFAFKLTKSNQNSCQQLQLSGISSPLATTSIAACGQSIRSLLVLHMLNVWTEWMINYQWKICQQKVWDSERYIYYWQYSGGMLSNWPDIGKKSAGTMHATSECILCHTFHVPCTMISIFSASGQYTIE